MRNRVATGQAGAGKVCRIKKAVFEPRECRHIFPYLPRDIVQRSLIPAEQIRVSEDFFLPHGTETLVGSGFQLSCLLKFLFQDTKGRSLSPLVPQPDPRENRTHPHCHTEQ